LQYMATWQRDKSCQDRACYSKTVVTAYLSVSVHALCRESPKLKKSCCGGILQIWS
jgi:hypothetical protein